MAKVFLILGSNVGNRKHYISVALDYIEKVIGKICRQSTVYETMAWGNTEQQAFLNIVIEVDTGLAPVKLLQALQQVEFDMGRERLEKWAPRTMDIDILFYESRVITEQALTIPHPLLHQRRFTLVPLAEIAPEYEHPLLLRSVKSLLDECPDTLNVKIYEDS